MLRSIRRRAVGIVAPLFCAVILSGCEFFAEEPDPTLGWSAQRFEAALARAVAGSGVAVDAGNGSLRRAPLDGPA